MTSNQQGLMSDDEERKNPVLPYASPRRKEEVSGVDALMGIIFSAFVLIVTIFVSVIIGGIAGSITGSVLVVLAIVLLTSGAAIWMLHRIARGERDISLGLTIGIYIGIGIYLLFLGMCGAMISGIRI